MTRAAMWALLSVVAAAAAVLSFSALRDLALLCGFDRSLAWLLPLVVDCGAAAGCVVWLGSEKDPPSGGSFSRFARSLTFVLLASSVCGNAVVHYLTAYDLQPVWWLVVAVSAIPPAVLGAVVHLSVLVSQGHSERPELAQDGLDEEEQGEDTPDWWSIAGYADTPEGRAARLLDEGAGRRRVAKELNVSEYRARQLMAERNGAAS